MQQLVRTGGTDQRRGNWYQDWSLLFYILIRSIEYPELVATIESIEDATITYTIEEGGTSRVITEYVQCKKHENSDKGSVHVGVNDQDPWMEGTFYIAELKDWLKTEREGLITADLLEEDPNSFYTALIFGHLQNKLEPFVPEELSPYLPILDPLPYFNAKFPVNYHHTSDPIRVAKNRFTNEDVSKRTRIVRTSSPRALKTMCWFILTRAEGYGVSVHKADAVLYGLQELIIEQSLVQGSISAGSIFERTRKARANRGIWQEAGKVLKAGLEEASDINKGQSLNWYDFDHERYAERQEFAQAWNAIANEGAFVTISKAVGTGKTTLCKYLMHRFLKSSTNNRAYYLSVLPATPLIDEMEFLEQNIHTDTLFIIDDEHIDVEDVFPLIERFWDYKSSAKARLVISSQIYYGSTDTLAGGRIPRELKLATHVTLPHKSEETVERQLSELRRKANLKSELTDRELSYLGGGVLGKSLLIVRCTQRLTGNSTLEGIFNNQNLKTQIAGWILSCLPRRKESYDFRKQVAPIFVISAFGLPVPEDYAGSIVTQLHVAGFLEPYDVEGAAHLYSAPDSNLALILQNQYKHDSYDILKDYIERYPEWLPHTFNRAADWKDIQKPLEELCRDNLKVLVNLVKNPDSELSLADKTNLLQSIRTIARGLAKTIYKKWAFPGEEFNNNFFPHAIDSARSAAELGRFLRLIVYLDKDVQIIRGMAEAQLMSHEAQTILSLIKRESCRLHEAASCLRSFKPCSPKFAALLYEEFSNSQEFMERVAELEAGETGLFSLLRYCEEIKGLDRVESIRLVERYFTPDKILPTALTKVANLNQLAWLLLHLHRLHPKRAAELLATLWAENEARVITLLGQENDLDTLYRDLYSFSKVNRLIAIRITSTLSDHLAYLLKAEIKYSIIGSVIEGVRNNLSTKWARYLCDSMDKNSTLQLLLEENRHAHFIGRFLTDLSQASYEAASWFEERLDYQYFLRVTKVPRLRDLVIVVRGFLMAASSERAEGLRQKMLRDRSLVSTFRFKWNAANNLTELGFCLGALLDSPFEKHEVERLLGFINSSELRADLEECFAKTDSMLHIANGLYAVAQYNLAFAKNVLQQYTDRIEAQARSKVNPNQEAGSKNAGREPRDGFGEDKNLVDLGCLFRVAAAVNSGDARRLVTLLKSKAIVQMAANESNVGRLAVFMLGVQQASRRYALIVADGVCSEEQWRGQVEDSEEIEHFINYDRALRRITAKKSNAFAQFLFQNYAPNITEALKTQANLKLISNWLRLVARTTGDDTEQHKKTLVALVHEAANADIRLWHLLEAVEALIEVKAIHDANLLCEHIVAESRMLKPIRNLNDWVVLLNKALYIERTLKLQGFTYELTKSMHDLQLPIMIAAEGQVVISAYAYHLFKHSVPASLGYLSSTFTRHQEAIIDAAADEPDSVIKLISLILTCAPVNRIIQVIEHIDWLQLHAWELGLVTLLFQVVYENYEQVLLPHLNTRGVESKKFLDENLNEHATNLEFALALHLAQYFGMDEQTMHDWRQEAAERIEEEASAGTRWLLKNYENTEGLGGLPYYVWHYLKETILRPTYLPWMNDIEQLVSKSSFGQNYLRNLSDLASVY